MFCAIGENRIVKNFDSKLAENKNFKKFYGNVKFDELFACDQK